MKPIPPGLEVIEGLSGFLKFLGVGEAKFKDVSSALTKSAPSLAGAAEILAHLTNLHATKQIEPGAFNPAWKLWAIEERPLSLDEARQTGKPLSSRLLGLIAEKGASAAELQRFVVNLVGPEVAAIIIPVQAATPPRPAISSSLPKIAGRTVAFKRWRGAEQQVLELLRALGWLVEDVSRQNIGYDIGGRDPEGKDGFIEVKSVDNPGQPFTLTSNEEAVAREKGTAYWLALVRQTQTDLEVAFIRDPARQLKLTRQCRQWVWECAEYQFAVERYPFE